jgi:hypothetical protein
MTLDVDSTVISRFGDQEGAEVLMKSFGKLATKGLMRKIR